MTHMSITYTSLSHISHISLSLGLQHIFVITRLRSLFVSIKKVSGPIWYCPRITLVLSEFDQCKNGPVFCPISYEIMVFVPLYLVRSDLGPTNNPTRGSYNLKKDVKFTKDRIT